MFTVIPAFTSLETVSGTPATRNSRASDSFGIPIVNFSYGIEMFTIEAGAVSSTLAERKRFCSLVYEDCEGLWFLKKETRLLLCSDVLSILLNNILNYIDAKIVLCLFFNNNFQLPC
mmetsp:Transcript_14687/g.19343  ORF Transcript_14687/g.19343 Transcript_14687/m.19343 type:complete len:117 (-) Transcript_14687:22-372(-)